MMGRRARQTAVLTLCALVGGLVAVAPARAFPPTPADPPLPLGGPTDFDEVQSCNDVVVTSGGILWCAGYEADLPFAPALFRFSAGGTLLSVIRIVGTPDSVWSLALDADDNVYALTHNLTSPLGNDEVRVYSPDGDLLRSWIVPDPILEDGDGLIDIGVDHDDRVYLLTGEDDGLSPPQRQDEVLVYDTSGTFLDRWFVQPSPPTGFDSRVGSMAVDPDGGVYLRWHQSLTDENGAPYTYYVLEKRTPDGDTVLWSHTSLDTVHTDTSNPFDLTFAPGAGLWVATDLANDDDWVFALLDGETGTWSGVSLEALHESGDHPPGYQIAAGADGKVLYAMAGGHDRPYGFQRFGDPTTLAVSQSTDVAEVHAMQTIEYEVTVENTGAEPAAHVWVDGGDVGDCDHGPIAEIPAGGQVTFTCAYETTEADQPEFANVVTVDSAQTETVPANEIEVAVLPPEVEDPPPFLDEFGEFGTGDGQFRFATGAAVAADGTVYVADSDNARVQVFDDDGNYVDHWGISGSGAGQFREPVGVALDSAGNVYVTDFDRDRVLVFEPDGTFLHEWGGPGSGPGQLAEPVAIDLDADDRVYVAEAANDRIQVFETDGEPIDGWGEFGTGDGEFDRPSGVAVSSSGDVYVTDGPVIEDDSVDPDVAAAADKASGGEGAATAVFAENPRVQRFTPEGDFEGSWGAPGAGAGQFGLATGIAVDGDGRVYVADTANHRIQVFDEDGTFLTRWGQDGTEPGDFDEPRGVAIGPNDDVFIADGANHRVQRFGFRPGLQGEVTEEETDGPVLDAFVAVLRTSDFSLVAGTSTDDNGQYAVGVEPGSYYVYLVDPRGLRVSGFYGPPTIVTIPEGRPLTLDAAMAPARGQISGTVTEDHSGGAVPIPDTWVVTLAANSGMPGTSAVTDAAGDYRLDHLTPGDRWAIFIDPDLDHRVEFFDSVPVPDIATRIPVGPGSEYVADAELRPAFPSLGEETIDGTVTEAGSASAIGGAWVVAVDAATFSLADTAVADASGHYELDVHAGDYKLQFLDPTGEHAMEWHDDLPFSGIADAVSVTAPTSVDADLDLIDGAMVGTVTEQGSSQALEGVWVVAIGPAGLAGGAVTDEDGAYVIDGLPAGTYFASFVDPTAAHPQQYWDGASGLDGADSFVITGGGNTTVDAALALSS